MAIQSTTAVRGRLTLTRSFGFCASHELRRLPAGHKCRRNHGHNYSVGFSAVVPDDGVADLARFEADVKARFDHRLLNNEVDFHPTSELLVGYLADWFQCTVAATLIEMTVSETATTSARFDGVTRAVTIAKTFLTELGDVTVVIGASALDEVGFVTDFGDLQVCSTYLEESAARASARALGAGLASQLAEWFIETVEATIHGYLISVRVVSRNGAELWGRS